jgi:mRNA-degrading endonuclease toxin of MazEF toxin-antitoxin module
LANVYFELSNFRLNYRRGDIWLVQFADPPEAVEQGFRRPAVIVSSERMNVLPLDVVTVVPCTSRRRANPKTGKVPENLVEIAPSPLNGLSEISYFTTEQIRAVSKSLRLKHRLGSMAVEDLNRVSEALCLVLELFP